MWAGNIRLARMVHPFNAAVGEDFAPVIQTGVQLACIHPFNTRCSCRTKGEMNFWKPIRYFQRQTCIFIMFSETFLANIRIRLHAGTKIVGPTSTTETAKRERPRRRDVGSLREE